MLIACTCNQPQRLAAALAPVRAALVAPAPIARWGLGYIQGGDVLLARTPRASTTPVDLFGPLTDVATDCAIAQADTDTQSLTGPDNTPPFRFRHWLFASTTTADLTPLLADIPELLRRNIRGRSPSEILFHLFLASLPPHALAAPDLSPDTTRAALSRTLERVGPAGTIALSNSRSLVVARTSDGPMRLFKLTAPDDPRGVNAFRGYLLSSSPHPGFEDIAPNHAVLISRDLHVTLAPL